MTIITVDVRTGKRSERAMTQDEIDALPPSPPRDLQLEIDALERYHMMPRAQREFMLTYMETEAAKAGGVQGLTTEQSVGILRAKNAGYRKVKELDEQIIALRGLL